MGIVFVSPAGERIVHCFRLKYEITNNEAEYEAVIHGLRLAVEMGLEDIGLTSGSQLVIRQIDGRYKINDLVLQRYSQLEKQYTDRIPSVIWRHICRINNRNADDPETRFIRIDSLRKPSIDIRGCAAKIIYMEDDTGNVEKNDWRAQIHRYLQDRETPRDRLEAHKLKSRATNYELRVGVLYRRSFQGSLLRCLSPEEGIEIMTAIHYGDARNHSGTRSLELKTRGQGYYWTHMHEYAKDIVTKCEEFQRYGKRIHAPGRTLNSILSVWPFAKWVLDIVGPLVPGSKQRRFLIVATDYFTKWVEAKATQHIRDSDIFSFIFEQTICRFGIPVQLVSDNGKQFEENNIAMFLNAFKIQSGKSTPLYP
ncbi:uncharacterized protein LOC113290420 [Papaver somniferum]|uniref:uncharacterized protein LOC113290420 n=1 Tax=Papaver somniferum TaxID=3469 RepID=UPI000E6F68E8|nr:uncharacterized protein LOC113290420 [Papaver somniferum]